MKGIVKKLMKDKGFGFIKAGGTDYFFHRSALQGVRFEELREGDSVEFEAEESDKGPRAVDISM